MKKILEVIDELIEKTVSSKDVTRTAMHIMGKDRYTAEKLLKNWLGLDPAAAASIVAMFLGARGGKVLGKRGEIENAIRKEL